MKPIIRSVTIFLDRINDWSRNSVVGAVEEAVDVLDGVVEVLRDHGFSVWTRRLSLPKPLASIYGGIAGWVADTNVLEMVFLLVLVVWM